MVAIESTVAYRGLEARAVEVQVQLAPGVPAFVVVGLPDKAVAESREQVRGALAAIGLPLPPKRITVNLSPADLPKEGSHYDLPIAPGLLAAIGAVDREALSHFVAVGELSLGGRIIASPGAGLHQGAALCRRLTGESVGTVPYSHRPAHSGRERQRRRSHLPPPAEGSADVVVSVARARDLRIRRYEADGVRTNAEADGELLERVATSDEAGQRLLADAAAAMRMSARGFHRVLKVARTIADLAEPQEIGRIHVAEALSYRRQAPRN